MSHALSDVTTYLRTKLAALKTEYPTIYKFTDEMLANIHYDRVDSEAGDYILIKNAGIVKKRFNYIEIGCSLFVKQTSTDDMYFDDFEFVCKGIDEAMLLLHQYRTTNNFYIIETLNQTGYNPTRNPDDSYSCLMGYILHVDVVNYPAEDLVKT